jgi:hypothetical protein
MTTDIALRRYFRTWGLSRHCADCREMCGCNLVTPRLSAGPQQLRQLGDVGGDAPVPWEDILRPLLRELTAVPRTGRSIPLVGIMTDTHITSSRR